VVSLPLCFVLVLGYVGLPFVLAAVVLAWKGNIEDGEDLVSGGKPFSRPIGGLRPLQLSPSVCQSLEGAVVANWLRPRKAKRFEGWHAIWRAGRPAARQHDVTRHI